MVLWTQMENDMAEEKISKNLLILRRERNLSQEQLAKISGVSRNYISMIERGEAGNVSTDIISKLAMGLGSTVKELTGEPNDSNTLIIPPALRKFAISEGLNYRSVDTLRQIAFRGIDPKTVDDWRDLYNALKPFLEGNINN